MPVVLPFVTAALVAQSFSVTAAIAPRAERFSFRFDNPSTFNTAELVPHFFEQRYDVIPIWFSGDVRYPLAGMASSTSVSMSLRGRTHGSDIDTFHQPSGDVVTSGTDGDVELRSWELTQRLGVGEIRGWSLALTAGYRHDRADFLPDDRIVTHTAPPSVTRTFITDRETTVSQVLSLGVGVERAHTINDRWRVTVGAGLQPVVRARLLVQLPDKYPGVDLVYHAVSGGGSARWTIAHHARGWRTGVTVSGAGIWSYRSSASYALRSVSIAVFAGTGK